jgi:hypothetical protein
LGQVVWWRQKRGRVVGLFTRCDEIYLFRKKIFISKKIFPKNTLLILVGREQI